MVLLGESIRGTSHAKYEVANQDACLYGEMSGYIVGIICDGVSLKSNYTFSNSELAAHFCAEFAYGYLKEHLEGLENDFFASADVIKDTFKYTDLSLLDYLEEKGIPYYDCQTTLLIVLFKEGRMAAGMAGDGGCIFQQKNGRFFFLVTEEKTSSSVAPISMPERWKFFLYDDASNPITGFILATDGIFDNLAGFEAGKPVLDFSLTEQFFELDHIAPANQKAYLKELLEKIPSHDDKTAIVFDEAKKGFFS